MKPDAEPEPSSSSRAADPHADLDDEMEAMRESALHEATLGTEGLTEGVECEDSGGGRGEVGEGNPEFQTWVEAFYTDSKALLWCQTQRKTVTPGGRGWPLDLSLMLVCSKRGSSSGSSSGPEFIEPADQHVALVSWTFVGKKGRIIDLDSQNKVVAVNPGCKSIDIQPGAVNSDSSILIPATGVQSHKNRQPDRPSLPAHVLKLKMVFETALCNKQRSPTESISLDPCFICGKGESLLSLDHAAPKDEDAEEPVLQCPICLHGLHSTCAHEKASSIEFQSELQTRLNRLLASDEGHEGAAPLSWGEVLASLRSAIGMQQSDPVCCELCSAALQYLGGI